jgi:hypothetical protein
MGMIGLLAVGRAEAGTPDCTDDGMHRARRDAAEHMAADDYPAAITVLHSKVEFCPVSMRGSVTLEAGWLRSDLAFAYAHDQAYIACIELASHLVVREEAGRSSRALFTATRHNLARCERGLARQYALDRRRCPFAIDGAIAASPA